MMEATVHRADHAIDHILLADDPHDRRVIENCHPRRCLPGRREVHRPGFH